MARLDAEILLAGLSSFLGGVQKGRKEAAESARAEKALQLREDREASLEESRIQRLNLQAEKASLTDENQKLKIAQADERLQRRIKRDADDRVHRQKTLQLRRERQKAMKALRFEKLKNVKTQGKILKKKLAGDHGAIKEVDRLTNSVVKLNEKILKRSESISNIQATIDQWTNSIENESDATRKNQLRNQLSLFRDELNKSMDARAQMEELLGRQQRRMDQMFSGGSEGASDAVSRQSESNRDFLRDKISSFKSRDEVTADDQDRILKQTRGLLPEHQQEVMEAFNKKVEELLGEKAQQSTLVPTQSPQPR